MPLSTSVSSTTSWPAIVAAMSSTWHGWESGLTVIYLQDFEEEVWAPACGFSAQLDASLGLVGTHEIEGETADDCHVLGPVAGSVARQVVLEGDVEEPVEAFDGPMAAGRLGEPFDVERR